MRTVLYLMAALVVMGLAFWSYQENYKTRDEISAVRKLHREIGAAHERVGMLQAEWAFQNRPDRLRDLAELNFERLGLLPLMPSAFGEVNQVIYPLPEILPITNPVDVNNYIADLTDGDPL